ncbi:Uncharacterised protein [uncultured Ruminococcus sp.]|uniref:Uncharacterized protein n=1 Tax=Hominimerdicola aceti TaxID=2981726 RepID=A0AAE3IJB7_9FIRM|nr:hypothetical protein [Hominimerdicola aceti]SCJ01479.1 Uncharacterised protein [uncultured Ruminococcus sp.]
MVNYSEFIEIVCSNLKITKPIVEEVLFLHTPTQLAEYVPADNVLKYRMDKIPLDTMFSIAHELRHIWQMKNCPEIFQNYINSTDTDIEQYNLQSAEIDANAYAMVIMESGFGITPQFKGLSEKVKKKISLRANEIVEE